MALGDVIARLSVELGLNSAAFEKNAKQAGKSAGTMGDRMEALGHKTGRAIKAVAAAGVALAGTYIVNQIKEMATAGLQRASALGEEAQQLGVTTSALQRYRFIATQVGIEQAVMDKGLARLTMTLGDLKSGAKGPTEAMERLGLSATEIARVSAMNAEQALPFLADKFKALGSDTERAAAAADIFGAKMGGKFLTLLSGGSAEINKLADAYKRLGIELTEGEIAKADEVADKMAALQEVIAAKQAKAAVAGADAVLKGTEAWEGFKIKLLDVAGKTSAAWADMERVTTDFSAAVARIDKQLGIPSPSEFTASIVRHFSESWGRIRDFFTGLYNFTVNAPGWVRNMVGQIADQITGRLTAAWNQAKAAVESVRQSFFNLWDKVTRRSYIPDMVDEIAAQMRRLDDVMVGKAQTVAEATAREFEGLRNRLRSLMDELFPEARAALEGQSKWDDIAKGEATGQITPEQADEMRRRLLSISTAASGAIEEVADRSEAANVRIVKSFKDMADETMGALQRLAGSIKSGGFLGILEAVIGLGLQLGSIGVFGKKVQTRINAPRVPGYALGTGSARPGLALVGERGPELVSFRGGERVTPNNKLGGMSRVQIIPSPYFDVVVDGRVQRAAPFIVGASVAETGARQGRAQSRRLA